MNNEKPFIAVLTVHLLAWYYEMFLFILLKNLQEDIHLLLVESGSCINRVLALLAVWLYGHEMPVGHSVVQTEISIFILLCCIAMKFGTNPVRMYFNHLDDPLTFHLATSSGQIEHFSNILTKYLQN